jgi:hypothetical protein
MLREVSYVPTKDGESLTSHTANALMQSHEAGLSPVGLLKMMKEIQR